MQAVALTLYKHGSRRKAASHPFAEATQGDMNQKRWGSYLLAARIAVCWDRLSHFLRPGILSNLHNGR